MWRFKQVDYAYIRPYLIREKCHHEPKIFETYSKLTMQDAIEFARRNPSSWTMQGKESFSDFLRSHTTASLFQSKYKVALTTFKNDFVDSSFSKLNLS